MTPVTGSQSRTGATARSQPGDRPPSGRVQYETARSNPPNLVCAVPMVMPLNLDHDTYFPGGALWEEFLGMLGRLGFGTQLYDQVTARAIRNDAWKLVERNFVRPEDFQIPMLFIGGWYDIYTDGVLNAFAAVRAQGGQKLGLTASWLWARGCTTLIN